MLSSLIISDAAYHDIEEIYVWYRQISSQIVQDFQDELEKLLNRIRQTPESYPLFFQNYRRALMHKFEYLVFFRIENDTAIVSLIVHQKRSPKHWKLRLN